MRVRGGWNWLRIGIRGVKPPVVGIPLSIEARVEVCFLRFGFIYHE
jgi:hypothetical protein